MKKNNLQLNAGFTYVELIVVLSIFAVMSAIVIFNYNKFEETTNIKSLASDIALQIVQAQKDATGGQLQSGATFTTAPAYGVYFNQSNGSNQNFSYFADFNNNNICDDGIDNSCSHIQSGHEVLNNINITNGNYIVSAQVNYVRNCPHMASNTVTVSFMRPNEGAIIVPDDCGAITYADITVSSPDPSVFADIDIYPSGRIEVK